MKTLLILSGKGGTGKTTAAAAFIRFATARAFADCDVDAPNLHIVSDMSAEPERTAYYGSHKAVIDAEKCVGCGQCMEACRFDAIKMDNGVFRIDEYACEGCGVCVYVCPESAASMHEDEAGELFLYRDDRVFSTAMLKMGRGNSGKLVTAVKLALMQNAPKTELAIIDGSPGIGCPVIASISGVNMVLIVAEPSVSGISDMERIIKTASVFRTKVAVCVNKSDVSPENAQEIESFCRENNIPFVGHIPYDRQAAAAINAGKSLADIDCPAGRALKSVFDRTMDILEGALQ
jgi:MinD superfamily P-loop ATPase